MVSLEFMKGATRGLREEWMEGNFDTVSVCFRVPVLQWSLQFLVGVFTFLSLILCCSYFGTFLSTWNARFIMISGVNLVGSTSRDSFSTPGGPANTSMGRCYACGQATYPTLPLGPSGATVAPTPLVPCSSVGGFLPVSSSPPAPPIAVIQFWNHFEGCMCMHVLFEM